MSTLRFLLCVAMLSGVAAQQAFAHHGKDFLIVESYEIPHPGDGYFVSSAAMARDGSDTTLELEPSILVGVYPRFAFELHSHIVRDPHEALSYEATAPSVHFQLTPPRSDFPLHVGLSAEYEIAARTSARDRAEARLIVETALGRSRFAGNLVGEDERAGDSSVGYAAGYRYEFTEKLACGLEAQGPFTHKSTHELLAAFYGEPTERVTLKAGAGAEFSPGSAACLIRVGVVWRFR